jgi:hypothetical protein
MKARLFLPFTMLALAGMAAVLTAAGCADRSEPPRTPETTSATVPGNSAPASPAEHWTTTGGPASPGVPSTGSVVRDPNAADAGVRTSPPAER